MWIIFCTCCGGYTEWLTGPLMRNKLRALYIAFAALIGYDVRFTRKGKAYFVLRDLHEEHKRLKKIRRRRDVQLNVPTGRR